MDLVLWDDFRTLKKEVKELEKEIEEIKTHMKPIVYGEWIIQKDSAIVHDRLITNYECSVCHVWSRYHSDYCPNCGANMRGEENERNN